MSKYTELRNTQRELLEKLKAKKYSELKQLPMKDFISLPIDYLGYELSVSKQVNKDQAIMIEIKLSDSNDVKIPDQFNAIFKEFNIKRNGCSSLEGFYMFPDGKIFGLDDISFVSEMLDEQVSIEEEVVDYLNVELGYFDEMDKLKVEDLKFEGDFEVGNNMTKYWSFTCTDLDHCWATVNYNGTNYSFDITTTPPATNSRT